MEQVTQQNSANSEESASAAEELSSQAQELSGLVAQFRLAGSQRIAATALPARARRSLPSAPNRALPSPKAKAKAAHGAGKLDPEQVLPLDRDDPEFADF
jgi:methyl-accepting chemotaxis protein